ncbi:MAG: alpha/beta hydrolase [Coriobacteriia bacterium]|nr:alpha/beta hydrolase [Coriobacteriia bacterium]
MSKRNLIIIIGSIAFLVGGIVGFLIPKDESINTNSIDGIIYQDVCESSNAFTQKIANSPKTMNKEGFDAQIPKFYDGNHQAMASIPSNLTDKMKVDFVVDGRNVYSITPNENYKRILLFIHGGAFVGNMGPDQMKNANQMAEKLNAKVYMPDYPLAPKATYEEATKFMDKVYKEISNTDKDIIFMGDSAGGNFCMTFSQYLYNTQANKLPYARVLFSPWVDVSMTNPEIVDIEPHDPTLNSYGAIMAGKMWAGDTDVKDPRVSPLFGETEDKIKTIFICSRDDICLPDSKLLYKKLKDNGCNTKFYQAQGLSHAFMNIIDLPETQEAQGWVVDFVLS